VNAVLLHASESWAITQRTLSRLQVFYQQMSVKDRKYTLAGQYQQSTVEGNWRRTSAAAARKKNKGTGFGDRHIEKKRRQHRQTGATADTTRPQRKTAAQEHLALQMCQEWLFPFLPIPISSSVTITIPIPFPRTYYIPIRIPMHISTWNLTKDGGGSTRQDWMESSALWL